MLHPDKTKMLFFSTTSRGEGVEIFCNNNNDFSLDPSLIKQIALVTSNDEIPAVKFLGIFIDPNLSFKYHTSVICKKLSKATCIHFVWPKTFYLTKT